MGEMDGKVAIVTGAGRMQSIGRSAAEALARLGADVVVTGTGRGPESYPTDEKEAGWRDVESTAEAVRQVGRRALSLTVDVANPEDVQRMVDQTLQEFGRIDILVNNAAYGRGPDRVPVVEMGDDVFRKVVEVKVLGTYLCSKAVAKVLIGQGQGGKIVNLSSGAGKRGVANTSAYVAGNFAVWGFTQSLALELGRHNINVNAVCPGPIKTYRMDAAYDEEGWKRVIGGIPMGRAGTPEEIGGFIAFLCTSQASFIHGQAININGGNFTAI